MHSYLKAIRFSEIDSKRSQTISWMWSSPNYDEKMVVEHDGNHLFAGNVQVLWIRLWY